MSACRHCGRELEPGRRSSAAYCDARCRNRAWRRRRAGVPADAYAGPRGAARGQVPLGALTVRERLALVLTAQERTP